jgi:hypothetical protein
MNKDIAEMIIDYGNDLSLYEDYSGRGMYGKTTTAITCDSKDDLMGAIGECFFEMVLDAKDMGEDYDTTGVKELKNVLRNLQQDSLWLGYIFY